jgi:hypothetical protein
VIFTVETPISTIGATAFRIAAFRRLRVFGRITEDAFGSDQRINLAHAISAILISFVTVRVPCDLPENRLPSSHRMKICCIAGS